MSSDPFTDPGQPTNPYSSTGPVSNVPGYYPSEKKHSGLGICSFIGVVLSGILFVAMIILVGTVVANDPSGAVDDNSPMVMLIGLLGIGMMVSSLASIGLGIACLFQSDRKRVFGILGLIISVLMFLAVAGLMVLGTVSA